MANELLPGEEEAPLQLTAEEQERLRILREIAPGGTANNAINEAPNGLGIIERGKLALGNEQGKIDFLRENFEDVALTEEHGLVVKENGEWKTVDPHGLSSFINDPLEFARDIADLADIGLSIGAVTAGATKGAAIGTAIAPGIGTFIGGLIGAGLGGAGSGLTRTSLGRFVGTYEGTAAEQASDIGLEMILSLGGQGVVAGARPAIGALIKAGKNITGTAPESVKRTIAGVAGFFNGTGTENTLTMMEQGAKVAGRMRAALAKSGRDPSVAQQLLGEESIDSMVTLGKRAVAGQNIRYAKGIRNIIKDPKAKNLEINMTEVIGDSIKRLDDLGIATIKRSKKTGLLELDDITSTRIRELIEAGGDPSVESAKVISKLKDTIQSLDKLAFGTVKGQTAARSLIKLNKTLNRLVREIDPVKDANLLRLVGEVQVGAKASISRSFAKVGLADEFAAINDKFAAFSLTTNTARKIATEKKNAEAFIRQALTPAKNIQESKALRQMAEMASTKGATLLNDIKLSESARAYMPSAPKIGLLQTGAVVGAIGAVVGGAEAEDLSPFAATVLAISSPRLSGVALRHLGRFFPGVIGKGSQILNPVADTGLSQINFFNAQNAKQLERLMKDSALFNSGLLQPLLDAAGQDEQTRQLLQQSGIVPGQ